MQVLDVYLRQKLREFDVYINELAVRTELAAYNRMVLYAQIGILYAYAYAAEKNSNTFSLDSDLKKVVVRTYAVLKNRSALDSSLADLLVRTFATAKDTRAVLKTSVPTITNMLIQEAAFAARLVTDTLDVNTQVSAKAQSAFSLDSSVDMALVELTKYATVENALHLMSAVNTSLETYIYSLDSVPMRLKSTLTNMQVMRHRLISEMQDLTIADLANSEIFDVVYITV